MNNKFPIYIETGTIDDIERKILAEETGRPVIIVYGKPKDCVLDIQETLRDKFAGKAMTAILTATLTNAKYAQWVATQDSNGTRHIVKSAYEVADTMLKESEKGE